MTLLFVTWSAFSCPASFASPKGFQHHFEESWEMMTEWSNERGGALDAAKGIKRMLDCGVCVFFASHCEMRSNPVVRVGAMRIQVQAFVAIAWSSLLLFCASEFRVKEP